MIKAIRWVLAAFLAVLICGGVVYRELTHPATVMLVPEAGARWMRFPEPFRVPPRGAGVFEVDFRKRFDLASVPTAAVLTVKALRGAVVFLDETVVHRADVSLDHWKAPIRVDLAPHLEPGRHVLRIRVTNENGPVALLAHSETLLLATGAGWEASRDRETWLPAGDVDDLQPPPHLDPYESTLQAMLSGLPVFLPVFLIVAALSAWRQRTGREALLSPSAVRWGVLMLWGVLALNSLFRAPVDIGFDFRSHLEYIVFVASKRSLPLATDGWQMFQSPLYYVVSAALYEMLPTELLAETAVRVLRVVPLLCGLLQVQLAYLAVRAAIPARGDLQILGTIVGGLLPMNLYASQAIGNEPLAAVLLAAALVVAFSFLASSPVERRPLPWLSLGTLLGLSLLTKVSGVLVLPAIVVVLGAHLRWQSHSVRDVLVAFSRVFLVAISICGWYYARNWVELGTPFLGGWDVDRGIEWWQDPGYRTPAQLLRFGASLGHPFYASASSFLDAIYSTLWADGYASGIVPSATSNVPWNPLFTLSGVLFAVLPCSAVVVGGASALSFGSGSGRRHALLAALTLLTFLAALLLLYIRVPISTTGKATYTLGLIPCYAILAASGLGTLCRWRLARPVVHGLLACWALCSYAGYFVW